MADPLSVLWKPAGQTLDSLGTKKLVDISDGDTPNIRMPIRMLSIDTPETGSENLGEKRDAEFAELAGWLRDGTVRVSDRFRDHILPRLEAPRPGSRHFEQGKAAEEFFVQKADERLTKPNGSTRNLFLRAADERFDGNGRLLAYVAPSYNAEERAQMSRRERATFNFDMVESGHAATFILYPSIPGEIDLPLLVDAAADAFDNQRGQFADPMTMPGYEYRMCDKLHGIGKKLADGEDLRTSTRLGWRSRYCADLRDRKLYGPEEYMAVPVAYRLWLWPDDVQEAIGMLNLIPNLE